MTSSFYKKILKFIPSKLFSLIVCILIELCYPKIAKAEWRFVGLPDISLHDIKISPSNPKIIYAGSTNNRHIFKSTDGGESWYSIVNEELPNSPDVNSIAISYTNSEKLYIGVYDQGVFKSINGGMTWIKTNMPTGIYIRSLAVDPCNDEIVYTGTGTNNSNGGIYKSTDGGLNWEIKKSGIVRKNIMAIAICKKNNNIIYAAGGPNIWKSKNQGETWKSLNFGEAGGTCMIIHPEDCEIAYAGRGPYGPYKTKNGGRTWKFIGNGMGATKLQTMVMSLENPNVLFATSREGPVFGVFKTTNAGEDWINITDNLPNHYTWGIDALNEEELLVSIAENGIWKYEKPLSKSPIILIPGFGGSWNLGALLSGGQSDNWKEIPILSPYKNLKQTLTSPEAGYIEGENYFEFYYDWRKRLDSLADDLNNYIENAVLKDASSSAKVNIIAHSMGGLVARAYAKADKYNDARIEKLITVGSPHKGVLKSYYSWEAGLIGDKPSWGGEIISQLLLEIHRKKYPTLKDTLQQTVPSIQDLLPIFDFLKTNGNPTGINLNQYLKQLIDSESLKQKLVSIHGQEDNPHEDTVEFYNVVEPSPQDKLLGLWNDGFPIGKEYTPDGDLTVLTKSALLSDILSHPQITGNHLEIIESETGIQEILNSLEISGVTPVTSANSIIKNALLFFLGSPANIRVDTSIGSVGHNVLNPLEGAIYSPEDKLIFIPEAPQGPYQIQLSGTDNGIYHLYLGQLTEDQNQWQTLKGKIKADETINLDLEFDPNPPQENFLKDENGNITLNLVKQQLEDLTEFTQSISSYTDRKRFQYELKKLVKQINLASKYINKENNYAASRYVFSSLDSAYRLRMEINQYLKKEIVGQGKAIYFKNELEEIAKLLGLDWVNLYQKANKTISLSKILSYKKSLQRVLTRIESQIANEAEKGENQNLGMAFALAKEKQEKAEEYLNQENFEDSYINLVSCRLLLLETTKLLQ